MSLWREYFSCLLKLGSYTISSRQSTRKMAIDRYPARAYRCHAPAGCNYREVYGGVQLRAVDGASYDESLESTLYYSGPTPHRET